MPVGDRPYHPSMRPLRVAVVGCGTAGPAAALMLHRDGHDVRFIERVAQPGAVGAGILLQHLGQEVLHRLGIGETLRTRSPEVTRVDAAAMDGRRVLAFDYGDLPGGIPGWGVHRGTLFETLLEAVRAEGVPLETGTTVTAVRPDDEGITVRTDTAERSYGLVIGATGRGRSSAASPVWPATTAFIPTEPCGPSSTTRAARRPDALPAVRRHPPLLGHPAHGAGPLERVLVDPRARYRAGHGPWGRRVAGSGAPVRRRARLPARPGHPPHAGPLPARALPPAGRHHPDEDAGVVLLGDAAHGMSPQLGAGGSLALADAWTLAAMLRRHESVTAALTAYRSQRRAHIRWYAFFSRLLVPAFQSDLDALAWPRDRVLGVMTAQPWVRRIMVSTLMGAQTSPWTSWSLPD